LVVAKDRSKGPEVNAYYKPFAEEFVRMRSEFIKKNQHSPALLVVLGSFDQNQEWKAYTEVVRLLDLSFKGSPTVESVKTYVLKKNAQIEAQRKANEAFAPGKIPPDIALPGVDGDTLRLSDLKGKVVLIDFWASWCKPCRMENPNVVRNYQKYNKDGFEVFSVSLDNPGHGDRWKGAIQQDGLIWPNHVSDLKGWQSSAAKAYNVRSIPFTVLLDREGKIIGTNIRGPKLEENLKTIFGY
jgi:thiol-disulfide isomerase/thioredoxin